MENNMTILQPQHDLRAEDICWESVPPTGVEKVFTDQYGPDEIGDPVSNGQPVRHAGVDPVARGH